MYVQFQEMTTNTKWDGQLKGNRGDYGANVKSLCLPVNEELVQKVMRMEDTVARLSKLASQGEGTYMSAPITSCQHQIAGLYCVVTYCFIASSSANVPLQNGIALFYEILPFVRTETRHYPPTNQFLTSCMQILGQVSRARGGG